MCQWSDHIKRVMSFFFISFLGIFIIPYLIMLFLEGIPLVCVEIVIGQHFQDKFLLSTWRRIHPSTVGLGISAVFISFVTIVYFNVIIAWCVSYFVYSLQRCLPWTSCPEGVAACTNSSSPSEYYWYTTKLGISENINIVTGILNWTKPCTLNCPIFLLQYCPRSLPGKFEENTKESTKVIGWLSCQLRY